MATAATSGTNPFDDSFEEARVSTNPFDSNLDSNASIEESESNTDNNVHESTAPEASWQYLGDLPYRRIPIYSNVKWENTTNDQGLAVYPKAALNRGISIQESRMLLKNTTTTKVAGCPHGGPIAAVTLPLSREAVGFQSSQLRLYTNAGKLITSIKCPPPQYDKYSAADVVTMGFTSRATLVIVMRDSLCLTYNMKGESLVRPFHILPRGQGQASEVQLASIYQDGVAVLSAGKSSALVELLDSQDDPDYMQTASMASETILPDEPSLHGRLPAHYALVTQLPTAEYAKSRFITFAAIAVLPRQYTVSQHPEVFLSTSDNSVAIVNAASTEILDTDCRARINAPIVAMRFAPNGRFLACYTSSSILTVISTSFETKVLDFNTSEGSSLAPLDIQWCGEDSVVLHWKNLGVLMVGPYGDWLRFPYEGVDNLYLIPEIDCCRIITGRSVEILQRVPPGIASLLRMGSVETAALLLDASDAFHSGSPTSEDSVREMVEQGTLQEAISACADAATKEFEIPTQRRLLQAASFGINYDFKNSRDNSKLIMGGDILNTREDTFPSRTTVDFVEAARKVRILNALRNPNVGFILTSSQFDAIMPTGVIARLIEMKRPALAASISQYMHLPKSIQLYARASKAAALVVSDTSKTDTELAEAAVKIIEGEGVDLKNAGSSSLYRGGYAIVAKSAIQVGRQGVANLLLMLETSVVDKVPALIATKNYADAVAVASSSKDADFIFRTVIDYERDCLANNQLDVGKAQATFIGTVSTKFSQEAFHTVQKYFESRRDFKGLSSLLVRSQHFADAGGSVLSRVLKEEDSREKQGMLAESSRLFGLGKDCTFEKASVDEFLDLMKDQEVLRTKYGSYDVAPDSPSLTDTFNALITFAASHSRDQQRLFADADKLAKKYRVPEKRFWHIKIKAFADSDQWANLRSFADSKSKSPVGFKPFARAAIRGKQPQAEILRYIDRIGVPEDRYDMLCEAGLWKKALDVAAKLRDTRRIINVKTLCNDTTISVMADEVLGRMT